MAELMVTGDMGTWPEVRDQVRHFPVRRHDAPTRGTNRFNREAVFGSLGVFHLRRVHIGPPPVCRAM